MRQLNASARARFRSNADDPTRTTMFDRFANAPLKWSRAFPDGPDGAISVYLQDVSPGWMDGDQYQVTLELDPGSRVAIRTTTYGKIHPSSEDGHGTRLEQRVILRDAQLSFCPEPVIPFRDADFTTRTSIQLTGSSRLFWTECFAPGRVHKGEQFQYRKIDALTEIEWNDKLLVWDAFRIIPGQQNHRLLGAWEKYSHVGSIWLIDARWPAERWPDRIEWLQQLAERKKGTLLFAASLLDGPGLSIRIAAHKAADIQQLIMEIWQMVREHMWEQSHPAWTAPGDSTPSPQSSPSSSTTHSSTFSSAMSSVAIAHHT